MPHTAFSDTASAPRGGYQCPLHVGHLGRWAKKLCSWCLHVQHACAEHRRRLRVEQTSALCAVQCSRSTAGVCLLHTPVYGTCWTPPSPVSGNLLRVASVRHVFEASRQNPHEGGTPARGSRVRGCCPGGPFISRLIANGLIESGSWGGVFAQRAHSANYYGDYPGNNPENHPPCGIMHNQFKTRKFKHLMLAMGPRDLNSAPYSSVHCSSDSMTSFQSSELTELPVVENSQLFAQRAHSARYAPWVCALWLGEASMCAPACGASSRASSGAEPLPSDAPTGTQWRTPCGPPPVLRASGPEPGPQAQDHLVGVLISASVCQRHWSSLCRPRPPPRRTFPALIPPLFAKLRC